MKNHQFTFHYGVKPYGENKVKMEVKNSRFYVKYKLKASFFKFLLRKDYAIKKKYLILHSKFTNTTEKSNKMSKDAVKKSPKANLEKQKVTAILMGMLLGVSVLFFAFEWSSQTKKLDESIVVSDILAEEEIEITRAESTPPPPPPPPAPETPELIEIVDEKVETKIKIDIEDSQDREQVATYVAPPPPKPKEEEITEEIFVVVEDAPVFPGGQSALMKYLSDNIRYPVIAQENGIQGRVTCQFVVERDGSITDVQVVRGQDPSLDKEAVRVIQSMPKWKPGKQRGVPVRVRYTLPVLFRLQN